MKLSQIVFNIQNLLEKGQQSDDHKLSDLQVAFIVDFTRAYLLVQEQNYFKIFQKNLEQTLAPIEMEKVDETEACGIKSGCYVVRSTIEIPDYLMIIAVTTLGNDIIPVTNFTKNIWERSSQVIGKKRRAYFKDGRLYLENDPHTKFVKVTAIFSSPLEVNKVNRELSLCQSCEFCKDDLEITYPIPMELIKRLNYFIMNDELGHWARAIQDVNNNAVQDEVPR